MPSGGERDGCACSEDYVQQLRAMDQVLRYECDGERCETSLLGDGDGGAWDGGGGWVGLRSRKGLGRW
jgi:hypothetical protein